MPNTSRLVVFPEAHSRNLSELHGPDGQYKYNGILLGDWGYLAEELQKRDRGEFMSPSRISSPSFETIKNLSELLAADSNDPAARAEQLQWCARLVQSDASDLVREIAAEGLGDIALSLGISNFKPAPSPDSVAGEDDLRGILESLVREMRLSVESGAETAEFRATCQRAMQLPLDLAGARRLHLTAVLLQKLEMETSAKASLYALVRQQEENLIGRGLDIALMDQAEGVALAALEGYTRIIGPEALLTSLTKPASGGLSDAAQFGILELVRTYGLPQAGMPVELQRRCLRSLLAFATDHPSARVRVQAMLALQVVTSDGPKSVREEDWVQWAEPQTPDMAELP